MTAIDEAAATSEALRRAVEHHLRQFLAAHRDFSGGTALAGPLHDAASDFILSPGKRVRPLLFLAGAEIFGMKSPARDPRLLSVATALELLHGFILIHDDLIDGSDLRRGRPTLHRAIEERLNPLIDREQTAAGLALVMGNLIFSLSQKALLDSRLPSLPLLFERFIRYTCDTGLGEISDILLGVSELSSVQGRDIAEMYALKTGRYTIECPLAMAAVAAGLGQAALDDLAAIAEPLGMAFQIRNDLDEFESAGANGVVPTDLLEGKKTYLVQTAYSLLDADDRATLELCLDGLEPSVATVSRIRDLVAKSDALPVVRRQIDRLFAESSARISQSSFDYATQERLVALFELLCAVSGMATPAFPSTK
jgi:geranylgeranyl diphosphate synthase type I